MLPLTLLVLAFLGASTPPRGSADEIPSIVLSGAVPGTLSLEEILQRLAAPDAHQPFVPVAPVGLPADLSPWIPADDPLTAAKVELGRELYFDPRLSADGSVACASCHHPALGWADARPVSTGIGNQKGSVSAPSVVNRIFGRTQFWDGRAATLEAQAVGPVENPLEMGFHFPRCVERLSAIEGYRVQFEAVFGGAPTKERIARALAAFERTLLAGASPYDYREAAVPWHRLDLEEESDPRVLRQWAEAIAGELEHPLSAAAERGRALFFGKAACSACHVGYDLSDEAFHNLGIGQQHAVPEPGRRAQSGDPADQGAFKTPGLHNVAFTAPYMHDGSLATLEEVVEHYDRGGTPNPSLSAKIFPLKLTPAEKADLVAFLRQGLSGEVTQVAIPRLP